MKTWKRAKMAVPRGKKKKKKRFPLASVDFSIPVMLTLGEAWKRL